MATIESIQPMALREEMCDPPTGDEVVVALSRFKLGKAHGLLPDVVKCHGDPLLDFTVSLFGTVWREGQVPME